MKSRRKADGRFGLPRRVQETKAMAKAVKREFVWLQCSESGDLNYRISVNVQGGTPKLQLMKYCPRLRKRTLHKVKRK
jgi:large subunit ribosomal protein L33